MRKVYEHSSGLIEERIYLGGFEIYRRWQAPTETTPKVLKLERETLHVMDGERRIALVETKTVDTSIPAFTPVTVVRLQLVGVRLDGPGMRWGATAPRLSFGLWDDFPRHLAASPRFRLHAKPIPTRTHDAVIKWRRRSRGVRY